jgi:hypothetical protein
VEREREPVTPVDRQQLLVGHGAEHLRGSTRCAQSLPRQGGPAESHGRARRCAMAAGRWWSASGHFRFHAASVRASGPSRGNLRLTIDRRARAESLRHDAHRAGGQNLPRRKIIFDREYDLIDEAMERKERPRNRSQIQMQSRFSAALRILCAPLFGQMLRRLLPH